MQRVTDLRLFVDTVIGAVYEDIKPLRWSVPRLCSQDSVRDS